MSGKGRGADERLRGMKRGESAWPVKYTQVRSIKGEPLIHIQTCGTYVPPCGHVYQARRGDDIWTTDRRLWRSCIPFHAPLAVANVMRQAQCTGSGIGMKTEEGEGRREGREDDGMALHDRDRDRALHGLYNKIETVLNREVFLAAQRLQRWNGAPRKEWKRAKSISTPTA